MCGTSELDIFMCCKAGMRSHVMHDSCDVGTRPSCCVTRALSAAAHCSRSGCSGMTSSQLHGFPGAFTSVRTSLRTLSPC